MSLIAKCLHCLDSSLQLPRLACDLCEGTFVDFKPRFTGVRVVEDRELLFAIPLVLLLISPLAAAEIFPLFSLADSGLFFAILHAKFITLKWETLSSWLHFGGFLRRTACVPHSRTHVIQRDFRDQQLILAWLRFKGDYDACLLSITFCGHCFYLAILPTKMIDKNCVKASITKTVKRPVNSWNVSAYQKQWIFFQLTYLTKLQRIIKKKTKIWWTRSLTSTLVKMCFTSDKNNSPSSPKYKCHSTLDNYWYWYIIFPISSKNLCNG